MKVQYEQVEGFVCEFGGEGGKGFWKKRNEQMEKIKII